MPQQLLRTKVVWTFHRAETPFTVRLDASDGCFDKMDHVVRFERAGSQPVETSLSANIIEWYLGNTIIGGLIGFLLIGPLTGDTWGCMNDRQWS